MPSPAVVSGNARFTVLTERLVRLEWAVDGRFEDRLTLAVCNRNLPATPFKKIVRKNRLTLRTRFFTLVYTNDGRPFSKSNLRVAFTVNKGTVTWRPGKKDPRNLPGTARTLDTADGAWYTGKGRRRPVRLCPGLVSQSGWAVYDDSRNLVLDAAEHGRPWPAQRPSGKRTDLYLALFGRDYRAALLDWSRILGRQPLPPRFTLGYWWSRYWAYTESDLRQLIARFERAGVPLDVLVIDMDWHLPGWTGYTWDSDYFPDPRGFLKWLRRKGVKVTLNLHPALGVAGHEAAFPAMARAVGLDPDKTKRIPFDIASPEYMDAYFRLLHRPLEKQGVDFWWMDWQQGTTSRIPGLDPLPWLNHLHWEDMANGPGGKRPLVFSRYGGMGAGRTPVGFSGDTYSTWKSLAFQPFFTASAANVLFGYWSHDIGGHFNGPVAPELLLRWVQFGVFSPVLRTHTSKHPLGERRFWAFPDPYGALMTDAVRLRYALVPYIYSENRRAMETGLSLVRPMYYGWPKEPAAYKATGQYMFGQSMLAAPVTRPADPDDELARVEVWLPKGRWFDTALGAFATGGRRIKRRYMLGEVPVFVRPGAIVPGQAPCMRLKEKSYSRLSVTAWPGGSGEYVLYEDDGVSQDYLKGGFAEIRLRQRVSGSRRVLEIRKTRGHFSGFRRIRNVEFVLPATPPPKAVTGPSGVRWRFRAADAAVVITLKACDIEKGARVTVVADPAVPAGTALGLRGALTMLGRVSELAAAGTTPRVLHREERLAAGLAQCFAAVERDPAALMVAVKRIRRDARRLPGIISGMIRGHEKGNEHVPFLKKALAMSRRLLRERL